MAVQDRIHLFGIRHHGPGSARSLKAALDALQPDVLLIEGPPDADELLPLVVHEDMRPPVALLVYAPDDPAFAAHYPFAEYSPEWQAIRYGLANEIPVRMMDLPQSVQMAMWRDLAQAAEQQPLPTEPDSTEPENPGAGALLPAESPASQEPAEGEPETAPALPTSYDSADPLRLLAEAAGYSESEQWWEHVVEQRRDPSNVFAAILEAMTALRESLPPETHLLAVCREAAMRQKLRTALAEGFSRIAVVCGAWHAPALTNLEHEPDDAALLADLPGMEVQATWVPWTHARLARGSGYGAGIDSPGWYAHLWATETGIAERWMIRVARLLREEDLDVTPAHVIEAVRLAEALAALRDRPLAGLPELNEAALTVFCFGNPLPMRMIEEKLIVGDALGRVPAETPMAPLQKDFERETRRLKMQPEAYEKLLDLDLRKPFDLERSHLLHRLALLNIPWGKNGDASVQTYGRGRSGTFHEVWRLKWQAEYTVLLIEAGQWGSTLLNAASAKVCQTAGQAPDLVTLTGLVEDVLLAELPAAIRYLVECLHNLAAVSSDVLHMMQSFPPLANVLRYGNVRQTDTEMIAEVVEGLTARICIGLPGACVALNDDAAAAVFEAVIKVDEAIQRLAEDTLRAPWLRALEALLDPGAVHGLVAGRACRILFDNGVIAAEEASRRLGLGLNTAGDPAQSAAWVEGFLRGSGQLLVHDNSLLRIIDGWLSGLPEGIFVQLLPLLRRTFSSFAYPERRSIGERVKRERSAVSAGLLPPAAAHPSDNFDPVRADAVLPVIARLLGLDHPQVTE